MFIDTKRNVVALRQEGHVMKRPKIHMALLTDGAETRTLLYKHCPPGGGRVQTQGTKKCL